MDVEITDEAVQAALVASAHCEGRQTEWMRTALEAALPHLKRSEVNAGALRTLAAQQEAAEAQTTALGQQIELLESVAAGVMEALGQGGESPDEAFRRGVQIGRSEAEASDAQQAWRTAVTLASQDHGSPSKTPGAADLIEADAVWFFRQLRGKVD